LQPKQSRWLFFLLNVVVTLLSIKFVLSPSIDQNIAI
jgi:hypothetical protein